MPGLEFEEFTQLVVRRRGQPWVQRLQSIWERAGHSIGCRVGPAAEFEAKVMMEGLKQIRTVIAETERHIAEHCSVFPEYDCLLSIPGFGPDGEGFGSDWGSLSF